MLGGFRRQRGQSLIETMVACLVLIPVFALVPLLGKFIDVKLASIAASRKLAFECTVRPEVCRQFNSHPELVDQLRSRFFRGNGNEVLAGDVPADAVDDDERRNQLWVDRKGKSLLEKYSDVGARVAEVGFSPFGSAGGAFVKAGPGQFGLTPASGLMEARVEVALSPSQTKSFDTQLDSLALRMQHRTTILTDAWAATNPSVVKQRVKQANSTLDSITDVAFGLAQPILATADATTLETRGSQFRLNEFDPDIVPADRLRNR